MSLASLSGPTGLPIDGPVPPTLDVVKNTGSIASKSRSSRMRSMRTEPTMPRHPMNPTVFMSVLFRLTGASQRLRHRRAHLRGPGGLRALCRDVARAKPRGERRADSLFDALRDVGL